MEIVQNDHVTCDVKLRVFWTPNWIEWKRLTIVKLPLIRPGRWSNWVRLTLFCTMIFTQVYNVQTRFQCVRGQFDLPLTTLCDTMVCHFCNWFKSDPNLLHKIVFMPNWLTWSLQAKKKSCNKQCFGQSLRRIWPSYACYI